MGAKGSHGSGATGCPICGRPAVRGEGAVSPTGSEAGSGPGSSTPGGARAARRGADPSPFCSARCQMIDLGRWLGEEYRVPDRDTVVWPPAGDDDGEPRG